ncbi:MAG: helix-turn-helix domain-containing protein [Myxococcota bacterium]
MANAPLTTDGIPSARQYDHWREAVRSTHESWDMPIRRDGAFHGIVQERSVGLGRVLSCVCDPCRGHRGPAELAQTARHQVGVLFVVTGRERIEQPGGSVVLEAGQFTLWDTTRPTAFEVPVRLRKLTLMLPPELLLPTLRFRDRHLGQRFDAKAGCGALLLAQLRTLAALRQGLEPASQHAALKSATELLAAAISTQSGEPTTTAQRVVARAERHILEHLGDPALSADLLARTLGLSRRGLDRAFAEHGRTVGRFVWGARLERCRRDLLLDRRASISEIAFRWGFSDAAHFSRAFRSSYGCSPSQYRRRHQG